MLFTKNAGHGKFLCSSYKKIVVQKKNAVHANFKRLCTIILFVFVLVQI